MIAFNQNIYRMNANIKILLQSENLLDVLQGVVDVLLLNAEDLSALLQAANRGISTKNLPEAENRGYGITTSRNMLVKGLGGTFLMMSGDAVYMNSPKIQHFFRCHRALV